MKGDVKAVRDVAATSVDFDFDISAHHRNDSLLAHHVAAQLCRVHISLQSARERFCWPQLERCRLTDA